MRKRIHVYRPSVPIPQNIAVFCMYGASLDGAKDLSMPLLDDLIQIERDGVNIVLIAGCKDDTRGKIGAICRYVYTFDSTLYETLVTQWGEERVLFGKDESLDEVRRAVRKLPISKFLTLSR